MTPTGLHEISPICEKYEETINYSNTINPQQYWKENTQNYKKWLVWDGTIITLSYIYVIDI